jgi:hypothetical protein
MRGLPASCFKIQLRAHKPYTTAITPHATANHRLAVILSPSFVIKLDHYDFESRSFGPAAKLRNCTALMRPPRDGGLKTEVEIESTTNVEN